MALSAHDIDWTTIGSHVYGRPHTIPQEIANLKHPDPTIQRQAVNFLLGYGQDFGSYYDTTPLIVGFVLETLADPATPRKDDLLYALQGPLNGMLDSFGTIPMKRLQVAIYDAVKARMDILLRLLDDPEVATRSVAAETLGCLTEDRYTLVPQLLSRIADEHEVEVGVALCLSVKRLLHGPKAWNAYRGLDPLPTLYDLTLLHPLPAVRVAAAQAAVELRPRGRSWRYWGLWQQITDLLLAAFLERSTPSACPMPTTRSTS